MARPLRIQYPDAWYHIMNRGRRSEVIFSGEKDYELFIELLRESSEKWNVKIAAYCLMPNHYHLLLQTPHGNISRSMRHIDGVYTQRYNRLYGCDGQLFRGRYKSIVVDADEYLLQLVRYIHGNPVRAGLAKTADGYPWSSHSGYLSKGKGWGWLYRELVYSMLAPRPKDSVKRYKEFMAKEEGGKVLEILEGKKWPSMLGSEGFVDRIRGRFYGTKVDDEIPESRQLAPGVEDIRKAVCLAYGIEMAKLLTSRRGVFNEPRNMSIYLTRRVGMATLKQIGDAYGIEKCSTVSSISQRMKALLLRDKAMDKRMKNLISLLNKSQEQT
jgi:REP element-mobilizing transposase RayT